LYWLELISDVDLITKEWFDDIYSDCIEIQKLLSSTIKTMKAKQDKK
jgi:four helix bundle protein